MGTIGNTARLAAFENDLFPNGVDTKRSKIHQDGGIYLADSTATIRRGMIVSRNASGLIVPCTGEDAFGVAKWGNQALGNSVNIDEVVTTGSGTVTQLKRGNVSNVVVRTAPDQGGSVVAAAGNYTPSLANGTLTWDAPPAVGVGVTLYVTYTYALTNADFEFEGKKFHSNTNDDIGFSSANRITVVTDWALIFTTEWDTSRTYAHTGAGSTLYCDANGRFTNDAGGGTATFVGKVFQLPMAGDPYLGVTLAGSPVIV